MKKLLFLSTIVALGTSANAATVKWWQQPTICRISNSTCYAAMGTGFDAELWDTSGNCRGMKLICPAALTAGGDEPKPIGKTDLAKGTGIKQDFDTSVLALGCFGARKIQNNGTLASVNGKYVNVYCRGVLDAPDEIVATGEITLGTQPTCRTLAEKGYAAVINGKCFGKYYNPSQYYIDCGAELKPSRLIVLNGADYNAGPSANTPASQAAADTLFKQMRDRSTTQREKYFKE